MLSLFKYLKKKEKKKGIPKGFKLNKYPIWQDHQNFLKQTFKFSNLYNPNIISAPNYPENNLNAELSRRRIINASKHT